MASVSFQKQPKLLARGMKEAGWRYFVFLMGETEREKERHRRASAIWRAWGGPKAPAREKP